MPSSLVSLLIPKEHVSRMPFRIQKRLSFIVITNVACFVAFLLLPPVSYLSFGMSPFFFMLVGLALVLAASLFLLRAGKLSLAGDLMTFTLTLASISVLFFMKYEGTPHEAYRPFAFISVVAVCNLMISLSKRQVYFFFLPVITGWIVFFATLYRPVLLASPSVTIAVAGAGFVGLTLENVILLSLHRLSNELLDVAESETEIARRSFDDLKQMVEGAREGISIGDHLLDAVGEVRTQSERVETAQKELLDNANALAEESASFGEASALMLADARAMREQINTQNSVITETSSTITEISSNLESISSIATRRRNNLDDLAKGAHRQKELVSRLREGMSSVEQSSSGIGGFIQTVQDIASRTALLSMNASIEAARAGAAGKGFAVVAQEIRKLSEETQRNAGTIETLLKENGRTVSETGNVMEEFTEFVNRNTSETSALIDAIDEILRGIGEMNVGANDMVQQVRNLVTSTETSANTIREVAEAVELQRTSFTHITDISDRLHVLVKGLETAVHGITASTESLAETGRLNIEQAKKLSLQG